MERPIKHYLAVIEQSVRNNWNEPALSDFQEPIAYTYGEMAVQVERLRKWLVLMNVNKSDKVAICARSCSHWAIAYLAVVTNGSTVVSILPDFT
ncbi:MAG: AMP-binding protein, partial [bacterium]|nr:AMP-binding protein [Candidatus Colousia faecequi]